MREVKEYETTSNAKAEVPAAVSFLSAATFLYHSKSKLAGGTLFAIIIGILIAFLSPTIYKSSAVIAPKEAKGLSGGSAILSQLGGLGGMVASQLGMGDNDLNRLEIILKSPQLAESVITTHGLLANLFPEKWDAASGRWKGNTDQPTLQQATRRLHAGILFITLDDKRKVLVIAARTSNPQFSADLVQYFLEALNMRIKEDVRADADSNKKYLETQGASIIDPLLREKIQTLIGMEVEKAMLVSSRAFDILEAPVVPDERDSPKRKLILALSAAAGFLLSAVGLLVLRTLSEMGIGSKTFSIGGKGKP